ncbi:MAG: BLUF domain-containing protein, partial [Rhodanobacter sp.]
FMELFGVAYTSEASRPLSTEDLDGLLLSARSRNALVGVTGVLLYGEGRFFQYFEGTRDGVDEVYARIKASRLHQNLLELEDQRVSQRLFNRWFMGFRETPASVLQKLSNEQWARELPWIEGQSNPSAGIACLLALVA